MAHLDHWSPKNELGISFTQRQQVKEDLNRFFWAWYYEHEKDVILQFLWIKRYVSHLRPLFVALFGEPKKI